MLKNKHKTILILVICLILVFIAYSQQNLKKDEFKNLNELSLSESKNDFNKKESKKIKIIVHLSGAVKNPGVYKLDKNRRLIDLVKAAGGLTEKADLAQINLAEKLFDGQKLIIPTITNFNQNSEANFKTEKNILKQNNNSEKSRTGLLNINRASQIQLEKLSGIGPSKAAAIIKYRQDNGLFEQKEDLLKISGIGKKTLANIENEIVLR